MTHHNSTLWWIKFLITDIIHDAIHGKCTLEHLRTNDLFKKCMKEIFNIDLNDDWWAYFTNVDTNTIQDFVHGPYYNSQFQKISFDFPQNPISAQGCREAIKGIKKWTDANPDFQENDSKQEYFAKVLSVLGKDSTNVDDKIIKKICNNSHIKNLIDK